VSSGSLIGLDGKFELPAGLNDLRVSPDLAVGLFDSTVEVPHFAPSHPVAEVGLCYRPGVVAALNGYRCVAPGCRCHGTWHSGFDFRRNRSNSVDRRCGSNR
jgi:hypothetical protein